jgi:hypothetical protein
VRRSVGGEAEQVGDGVQVDGAVSREAVEQLGGGVQCAGWGLAALGQVFAEERSTGFCGDGPVMVELAADFGFGGFGVGFFAGAVMVPAGIRWPWSLGCWQT